MNDNLRTEKKILKISLVGSLAFLLAECLMAYFTGSHAVLMDCVFDIADLIMIGPFLVLVPLLYQPYTEKRPYGYAQVESLFIIIKCSLLAIITIQLIIGGIQMIFSGGNSVDATMVAIFELCVSATCVCMYILLRHFNKKFSSPSIQAELYIWKLDALSTAGVGIAFLFQLILDRTALAFLSPYVDPAIAVILAIFLLKEPLSMLKEALRNLVLFAPKEEVISHLYDVASTNLGEVEGTISFVDVIKTGRKMWVDIYFLPQKDSISMSALKQAQDNIHQILAKEYTSLYVKLIPETEAPVRPAPKQSPDKLRRR